MKFDSWYANVKAVLPENLQKEILEFEKNTKEYDVASFIVLFNRFIKEKIGKSASNPVSVRVWSKMTGREEDEVKSIFIDQGLI